MSTNQEQASGQLKEYQYSPLPNEKSIRLLNFSSGSVPEGGEARINLSIHSLESAPAYQCLSYTWGNPISQFSEDAEMSEIVYESTGEIGVDDSVLSARYNLIDALEMLRNRVESDSTKHFWIDAICINQADMQERASQVSIMDQIFRSAEEVIAWMGPEDEFTTDAMCAIEMIGNIRIERHAEIHAKDWSRQELALIRVGAQPLHPKSWLGMMAFFSRPLFQRIWVVQEVILPKKVTLICGNEQLPWDLVSKTVSFLITTDWNIYLASSYFREHRASLLVPGIYKKLIENENLQFSRPLMYMEHIRTFVKKLGHDTPFLYLLHTFRLSEASDPRDKIYALLSLAWREKPPFSTHPDVLIPDYTIPARALYIKTTRLMIQSYADLRILAHVESEDFRKMQDLPSWVPDFSINGSPAPLDLRSGAHSFKASKGLGYTTDTLDYYEETLVVVGFRLSVVKDAADRLRSGIWWETVGETDDLLIKIFQFAAEISEIQMMTMSPSTTRAEILWRTFCGDVLTDKQYPAPSDLEDEFFRWLCLWIMARTYIAEEVQNIRQVEGKNRWEGLLRPIVQLLEQEPETSIFHLDHFQSEFVEAVTTQDNYENLDWVQSSFNRWWLAQQKHHSGGRRHLQDNERRYCLGPNTSEIGDEIWVIAGMPAPCLLRQVESGKYKYLGEVYIHGIMNGELADHNLLKPVSTITIV